MDHRYFYDGGRQHPASTPGILPYAEIYRQQRMFLSSSAIAFRSTSVLVLRNAHQSVGLFLNVCANCSIRIIRAGLVVVASEELCVANIKKTNPSPAVLQHLLGGDPHSQGWSPSHEA